MRNLRLVAIGATLAVALLAAWSAAPIAQPAPPSKRWCVSLHAVHPSLSAREAQQRGIPAGYAVYPSADPRIEDQLLREIPIVHAGDMADAQAGTDPGLREPIISFRLSTSGARKFGQFTRENVGRPVAIVIGGRVVSAPVVREPILGGQGQISGTLTAKEAQELAARIRSGTCTEVSRLPSPAHAG